MALASGKRLGVYEVTSLLGEGGMGAVYRARDTKLDRDVALKILPESFATDPDRLRRFEREAKTLASLNHPHIAQIHGFEQGSGTPALVMELVEGEDLSQRISRGPFPIDEALSIAKQIAEALEAAHDQGIIHRDLKPANIKVRADGTVKVLDFGLAKASEPAARSSSNVSMSPTITAPAITQAGMILGTAAYMAPEQAKGRAVDRRADIWAFACVLYEMLTGKRPFGGEGVADTLAAVLHKEPDWDELDPLIPARIRMVLQRCLRKDPRHRLQDIADVALVLGGAFESPAPSSVTESGQSAFPARSRRNLALAAVAGLAIGGVIAGAVMWTWRAAPSPTAAVRMVLTTPDAPPLRHGLGADLAITPDGTHVIYQSDAAGGGLASRALNQLQPAILRGTSASAQPFASPDGAWVGYWDEKDGSIKKVSIEGGPAITLTPPQSGFQGASWGDGVIVFASARGGGLFRVPDSGGDPERLTQADEKRGEGHAWPQLLPGSHAVLFTHEIRSQAAPRWETVLLDLRTREHRVLIPEGSGARYVATGHLVYAIGDTLRAVGFDLAGLEVRGTPVPVLDGVMSTALAAPNFSVSSNGSLVYVMSPAANWTGRLVWVSRDGREVSALITEDLIAPQFPRLSPDGRRVALTVADEVWMYDLDGALPIRLTSGGRYLSPIWAADGRHLVMEGSTPQRLSVIATDGSEQQPQPASALGHFHPMAWNDGSVLAVQFVGGASTTDIVRWQPDKPDEREAVVQTAAQDGFRGASLSPDGRWLAHTSDQSGRTEVWVRPYPGPGVPVRVSTNGGIEPVWSRTGHELYYLEGQRVMAVAVSTGSTFRFKPPTLLFDSRYRIFGQPWSYDVAADGRFLMVKPTTETHASPQVVVVLNWHEELKRLAPLRRDQHLVPTRVV
jgi:serine/threonine-protein kinase